MVTIADQRDQSALRAEAPPTASVLRVARRSKSTARPSHWLVLREYLAACYSNYTVVTVRFGYYELTPVEVHVCNNIP